MSHIEDNKPRRSYQNPAYKKWRESLAPERQARLSALKIVSGKISAVRDLFRMVPVLRRLNISGLFTRLRRGRPLTPTQFYRYMNRY